MTLNQLNALPDADETKYLPVDYDVITLGCH